MVGKVRGLGSSVISCLKGKVPEFYNFNKLSLPRHRPLSIELSSPGKLVSDIILWRMRVTTAKKVTGSNGSTPALDRSKKLRMETIEINSVYINSRNSVN